MSKKLKIAIYTICKNEQQHVARWAASNTEADVRLVCDTGSTDDTVKLLKDAGVWVESITVSPWRFDVARATSLNLLPKDVDVCIYQDLDEELLPGWRQQIEQHWRDGVTIGNHRYRHNGGAWQWHSKIHARHGCWWTGAVHETLKWAEEGETVWIPECYLDEHQDIGKSRSSYLNLLEKKISEGDRNWRTYSFLSNDYLAAGQWEKSIATRIKSYELCDEGDMVRSYIAKNIARFYASVGKNKEAVHWFNVSINHSEERESLFAYAEYYYNLKDWDSCYLFAKRCIAVTVRRDGFTYDPAAWGSSLYDYAALAAYNLGLKNKAVEYGEIALGFNPDDERLKKNLNFYRE